MKIIRSISFLLIFCFCGGSCDIFKPLIIDGQREHVLPGKCGPINIKGSSFGTIVIIGCTFNGRYHINRELFKIKAFSNEDTITNIRFQLDGKDFIGNEIETKDGETLTLDFTFKSTVPYQKRNGTMLLLPSNFVMCEGEPIITDTIKIKLLKNNL